VSRRRRRRGPVTPPKDVEMRIDNMLALVKDGARDVPGVYRMTSVDSPMRRSISVTAAAGASILNRV